MKSPADKAAQGPSSKKGTSTSNQSPESALSEEQQGNQEGSQVHQQSPGQHDTSPREDVNNVVPLPMNVPQHQQQSSSQHGNHSPQTRTNPPVNPPPHDHHNPVFDDMYSGEHFDDMPSHFDHLLEHDLLIGNGSFEDNDSHVNVHSSAQVQNYQQGEQNVPVVSPPAHQSMMDNYGGPHQQPPHPLGAHYSQQPAIPQHYAVPNGHGDGAQHLSVGQQIHSQVQVPVQHQVAVQNQVMMQHQSQVQDQANIQQQDFIQYLAYLQHQDHLQHEAAINQQILVQHPVPDHHQVAVQHPAPVQHQVPEVPVPVPIAGAASPAGDHGPPTPHPEADHPSVITLHDVEDDLDADAIRELIRAAAAVLFGGHPQCRRMILGHDGVEVRCTASS